MRHIALGAVLVGLLATGVARAQTGAPPPDPNAAQPATAAPAPPPIVSEPAPQPPLSRAPEDVPLIDLSQMQTHDLRLLYFDPAETYLTPYVGRSFENAMAMEQRLFGWRPWDKTTLLLKDFSDYGNAAARASPNNAMILDIAPLSLTYETFSAGERFFTLDNHELTHVATMDVWNDTDAFWRHVFGGKPMALQEHPESILYNYLATPRVAVPRWYLEGSAVFMETWMAGGYGRAQGGYDEMVFRAMVRDNAYFYSPVGLESAGIFSDFQVGVNDYLYGTRFFSYLALHYSPEQVIQWLRRDEGSAAYYETQFEHVFGKPLRAAWADWIAWEHTFQQTNLDSVRAFPETTATPLAPRALGSISRAFIDPRTDDLIGAFRYPGVIAHVGVLSPETGDIRRLTDIKGAMLYRVTSLAYDPATDTAWYTTDNYAYRDIMQLDVATGRQTRVLHDARIGDIVFNPADRSLWGLRHLNGYVTLVRIPPPYTSWNQIHTFPFGTTPFDLDISPDGTLLSASVGEVDGKQSVEVFRLADLSPDSADPIASFSLGSSTPEGFVFSPDGRYLYGSAYYTGVSNIYRYELATHAVEAVSNASTGFFRPIPRADGSLVVFEYTGQGFRPATIQPTPLQDLGAIHFLGTEIVHAHPVVTTWAAGSPNRVPLDSMITDRSHYAPRNEMRLGAAYPVLEGYRGDTTIGYHVIFEDPLQFNQLTATLSYSPNSDRQDQDWHFDAQYKTLSWRFRYWHNDADFYDLFGPTERARRGDAGMIGYRHSFIYDPPRQLDFKADLAYYTGLDTLPQAQEVQTQFDTLTTFSSGLAYTNTTKSLGAVDHEKGWGWNLDGEVDYANSQTFPSLRAGLDFGVPLPLNNSSFWLYTAAGFVEGDAASPLGSFYMGGFGNNYVDDREVKRYREFDSFPGFDINEISARRFVRTLAEINLPPLRFRDVGVPSLYLSSARTAFFAGVLEADPASGPSRTFETVGAQIDWNFTAASRLPMVFSLGYAEGFEDGERRGGETLVSLKIM
ncbi:MAG TPA: hypothetical protein VG841_01525 [Caulobacterales bacterium]|nr:hypothetical protein [Caulobacterales bacterium]